MYKVLMINKHGKFELLLGDSKKVNSYYEKELDKFGDIEILIHEEFENVEKSEDRYYQISNDYSLDETIKLD